jgi:hypothetical protein
MVVCLRDKCFLESTFKFQPKGKKFKSLVLVRDDNLEEWSVESRNGNRYHIPTTLQIFKEFINKNKGIPVIINHQIEDAIPVGRIYRVWEGADGIWVEGVIDESEKDVIEKIKNDILTNVSIHVLPDDNSFQDEEGIWWVYPKDVLEVSLVGVNGIPGAVIEFVEGFGKKFVEWVDIKDEKLRELISIAKNSDSVEDFISKIPSEFTNKFGYCAWIGAVAKYFWPDIELYYIKTKRGGHVIIKHNNKYIDTFNKIPSQLLTNTINKGAKVVEMEQGTLKTLLNHIKKLDKQEEVVVDSNTTTTQLSNKVVKVGEKVLYKRVLENISGGCLILDLIFKENKK